MAEIVGVAASAVTLAALFSSCIDCFSYFKAAQNCPTEAESLLVKLDCEKARLLVWANTVGILQTDPRRRHSQLADVRQNSLVRRCIEQIITLLTDARKIQEEYGGRATSESEGQRYLAVLSVNSMNLFQSTKRTFFARAGPKNAKPGMLSRIKWAIRDATKFRILLVNLRDFVDHLIELVTVSPEAISNVVEEDIVSTVDLGSLRLIEQSCDESSYPQWSIRASEVIKDSEVGTEDRRSLLEILGDTEAMDNLNAIPSQSKAAPRAKHLDIRLEGTFLVLTETCLNVQAHTSGPCAKSEIGTAVSKIPYKSSFASSGKWSLGRRIFSHLDWPLDWNERYEQREAMRLQQAKLNFEIPSVEKISRLYVYCGACACAISTAQSLATDGNLSEYMDVVVRVDDRLTTSCRDQASTAGALEAIRDVIEDDEANGIALRTGFGAIDCPALERRLYSLEQDQYENAETGVMLQDFVLNEYRHKQGDLWQAGVIIIIENDMCSESLKHAPILNQSRRPRAGEIYKFKRLAGHQNLGYHPYAMSFVSRFGRSKAWLDREKARKESSEYREDGAIAPQSNLPMKPKKRARTSSTSS